LFKEEIFLHLGAVGFVKKVATEEPPIIYEGWNFNNGNYLFTTDTK